MEKMIEKLLATGISVAGGIVGTKLVGFGWKLFTGEDAPNDATEEDLNLVKALAFAGISAAISAVIRVSAQRGAGKAVRATSAKLASTMGRGEV